MLVIFPLAVMGILLYILTSETRHAIKAYYGSTPIWLVIVCLILIGLAFVPWPAITGATANPFTPARSQSRLSYQLFKAHEPASGGQR